MVKMLMERQGDLNIDLDDLKCVSIAALCHDLGHGPFSHLFDRSFLPSYHPHWKHEHASIKMLEHLLTQNNLLSHFTPQDLLFIEEIILPPEVYKGRGPDKMFLYEIVSNRRTGIDVDKWDYFSRDSLYLGLKSSFDSQRLMKFVRVMVVGGMRQICYRDKVCDSIAEMFNNRLRLFKTAYFHKTTLIIDDMVSEVLKKANDHLRIKGANGKSYKLSECVNDMQAYSRLTDDLLMQIYHSDDPLLADAIGLIERIFKRLLPKYIGKFDADHIDQDEKGVKNLMIAKGSFEPDDIIVLKRTLDSGMDDTNPLHNCYFYSKNPNHPVFNIKTIHMEAIKKTHYLVYVRNCRHFKMASEAYEGVCGMYGLSLSKGIEKGGIELTPNKETSQNYEDESDAKRAKRAL